MEILAVAAGVRDTAHGVFKQRHTCIPVCTVGWCLCFHSGIVARRDEAVNKHVHHPVSTCTLQRAAMVQSLVNMQAAATIILY